MSAFCRPNRILRLGLLAALLVSGCAEVDRVREAQKAFSEAAAAENAARFGRPGDALGGGTVPPDSIARSAYGSVVQHLNALEGEKQKASLQQDNLYGAALALKALAYWRLDESAKARAAKAEFDAETKLRPNQGPRDVAMMNALEGLIINREKYLALDTLQATGYCQFRTDLHRAMNSISTARARLPKGHPAANYLNSAVIAAYINLHQAREKTGTQDMSRARVAYCEKIVKPAFQMLLDEAQRGGDARAVDYLQSFTDLMTDAVNGRSVAKCTVTVGTLVPGCRDDGVDDTGISD